MEGQRGVWGLMARRAVRTSIERPQDLGPDTAYYHVLCTHENGTRYFSVCFILYLFNFFVVESIGVTLLNTIV